MNWTKAGISSRKTNWTNGTANWTMRVVSRMQGNRIQTAIRNPSLSLLSVRLNVLLSDPDRRRGGQRIRKEGKRPKSTRITDV